MATIRFKLRGKSIPAKLYCRFSNGRALNLNTPFNLSIDPKHWDAKQEKIRNLIEIRNRDEINRKLALLKIDILDRFNLDFANGEIIDIDWLKSVIRESFDRPREEKKGINAKHTIYFIDFSNWWLENKSNQWLVAPGKYMCDKRVKQYENVLNKFKIFAKKSKHKIEKIDNNVISEFVNFLVEDSYAPDTIKRTVGRLKFFLNRAEEMNLKVDKSYKQRVFIPKGEMVKDPYFNAKEIEMIYNYDFSFSEKYDNVRDNLIIACWTGLRVSDFMRLDTSNFIDNEIQIRTKKTGTPVVIPVHPMVEKILIKRNGKLPHQISDVNFNIYVKEVCKLVGFKNEMKGKLHDKDRNRDILGVYPKYKLVSSHIGRRSFATNLFGEIDDAVIMAIGGWSSKKIMLSYIKRTNFEYAKKLKDYWKSKELV